MDRRHYLAALAAIVGAGCVGNETTPDQQSSDSPTQTTPDQQPSTPTYEPPTDSPPGEFTSLPDPGLWEYDLPDRSARIAVGDELYIATNTTLACLSPSGDTTWTTDSTSNSYAVAEVYDLTVAKTTVYYTARDAPQTGEIGAHRTASGEQRWTTTLDRVPDTVIDVTEDTVFASESYDDPGEAPVFAFDAETGEEQWRTFTGMDMGSAVSHGLCLVYSVVDGLTALDTATGEVRWERTPGDEYGARLEVIDDTLCLFMDGTVHGYALPDGTHRWEQSLSGDAGFVQRPPLGSAQAADLYIADDRANLTALNATTGEKQWTVTTHWGPEGYEGMCLGTDSLFYHSGTALASYDLVDGTRQWAYSLGSEYEASGPFVSDGTVFLITQERNEEPSIKTFDAEMGSRDWRVQLTTGDSAPPRIAGVFNEYAVLRTDSRLIGLPITHSTT